MRNKPLGKPSCTIREVAIFHWFYDLILNCNAFWKAVHTSSGNSEKITTLHEVADNFEQFMTLDATSQRDILRWISHLDSEYALIQLPATSVILCTDASFDG